MPLLVLMELREFMLMQDQAPILGVASLRLLWVYLLLA